jgi:hypothetical protein
MSNGARSFELLILLIVLVILLVGAAPAWPYSRGWGYYPSGGLGLVLTILVILLLLGQLRL